jgi:hypothetical protein
MRWLRVATAHTSYLYERGLSEVVDRSVLRGLEELAKRHVRTAVLDRYLHSHQPKKVGEQSEALNANERHASEALTALPIFEDAMHLGVGEAALIQERRSKSPGVIAHQIVGVAALLGGHNAVRRLVDCALASAQSTSTASEPAIDWQIMLHSNVGHEHQQTLQEQTLQEQTLQEQTLQEQTLQEQTLQEQTSPCSPYYSTAIRSCRG